MPATTWIQRNATFSHSLMLLDPPSGRNAPVRARATRTNADGNPDRTNPRAGVYIHASRRGKTAASPFPRPGHLGRIAPPSGGTDGPSRAIRGAAHRVRAAV